MNWLAAVVRGTNDTRAVLLLVFSADKLDFNYDRFSRTDGNN